jgi:biofilm PGA synthesis protein PgaD
VDQSGQGEAKGMKSDDLIINSPNLVKPHEKFTAIGITVFFWLALLWLWQPAVSLIAWALNIRFFYNHMIVLGGLQTLLDLAAFYITVILVMGATLLLWAKSNEWRFKNKVRRSSQESCDMDAMCETFAVDQESLRQWQQMPNLRVLLNEDQTVASVEATRGFSGQEPG